ncbi:MAG: hypothetical protein DDG58_12930 [Ardenticatenia bacterium]|jgi:uncharacterized protein (TIGR00251 family)|nr:MAG: hypothetical protein DDG58_12930 [Ardenticatenia bacterium]
MRKIEFKIREAHGGAAFPVHVTPRSDRDEISGWHADMLRVRLTVAPVEGAANEALTRLLAKCLGVPRRDIEIIKGGVSRNKLVCVVGLSPREVEERIASFIQDKDISDSGSL